MIFTRQKVEGVDLNSLRHAAARTGWLLEGPDGVRAGLGGTADVITLPEGLGDVDRALDALRTHQLEGDLGPAGTGIVAFGSLPFDRMAPATLTLPHILVTVLRDGDAWITRSEQVSDSPLDLGAGYGPDQGLLEIDSFTFDPTADDYAHGVARAVDLLRRHEVDKVVLARAVTGTLREAADPAALAARLRSREPACTIYSFPTDDGRRFVGATPELLVRRTGATASAHPLAGTIAVTPHTGDEDFQSWLLGSAKNRHEHAVVADEVVAKFASAYERVTADAEPSIVRLRSLAHLGTWVHASCEHEVDAPDALEILRLMHPTAAVGGIPRDEAYRLITTIEHRDRGVYAGPLGWMDARGDGEWWVGFRGVLLHGREFEAWAGAGIVAESDPMAEREETRAKLSSVLAALLVESI